MLTSDSSLRLVRWRPAHGQLSTGQLAGLASLVLSALAAAVFAMLTLADAEAQTVHRRTSAHARERIELLRTTTQRSLEVLHSLGAFLSTAPDASRQQFGDFVHGALERLPELQALEWVPAVAERERATYEARARSDGLLGFALTELERERKLVPARGRPEYFPVFYAEPQQPNSVALGLDLSADPVRKSALERAQRSGQASATAPIRLAQETAHGEYGFLVFLPVFGAPGLPRPLRGAPLSAPLPEGALRLTPMRASLRGFALAVFRISDLMRPALSPEAQAPATDHAPEVQARVGGSLAPLRFEVEVVDAAHPEKILFRLEDGEPSSETQRRVAHSGELLLAGRSFRITFTPTRAFLREQTHGVVYGYPLLGLFLLWSLAAYLARDKIRKNQLAHANALLEAEIGIRKSAQLEAAAARDAQSKFLASVSHELRTPLNAIVGYSQLLSRHELPDHRRQQAFSTIVESSNHLLSLVDEVLDLSKIEAGHVELHEVDFNLGSMIAGLSSLVSQKCERRGLTLRVEGLGSRPFWVRGDEGKLRQVLLNLLGNAVKFTAHGEVRLRVVPEEARAVRFEVIDTGTGISPADQQRVFGAFVQAGHDAEHEGIGLGLAISHRLVELMGGELLLRSTPGWGSDFFFTLQFERPLAVVPSEIERRYPSVELAAGTRCHALVVDDVPVNRELLSEVLVAIGCTVTTASSGFEALELLRTLRPAIVFSDILMPGMDGIELARRVLGLPELASCKLVALSASALKGQREAYLLAGFHDFIAKPFRMERINDCLASLLGLSFVPRVRADEPPQSERDASTGVLLDWPALSQTALPEPLRARIRRAAELYQTTRLRSALAELRALGSEPRALAELFEAHAIAYDMRGLLAKLDALPAREEVQT